jgi:hypothetical protein
MQHRLSMHAQRIQGSMHYNVSHYSCTSHSLKPPHHALPNCLQTLTHPAGNHDQSSPRLSSALWNSQGRNPASGILPTPPRPSNEQLSDALMLTACHRYPCRYPYPYRIRRASGGAALRRMLSGASQYRVRSSSRSESEFRNTLGSRNSDACRNEICSYSEHPLRIMTTKSHAMSTDQTERHT